MVKFFNEGLNRSKFLLSFSSLLVIQYLFFFFNQDKIILNYSNWFYYFFAISVICFVIFILISVLRIKHLGRNKLTVLFIFIPFINVYYLLTLFFEEPSEPNNKKKKIFILISILFCFGFFINYFVQEEKADDSMINFNQEIIDPIIFSEFGLESLKLGMDSSTVIKTFKNVSISNWDLENDSRTQLNIKFDNQNSLVVKLFKTKVDEIRIEYSPRFRTKELVGLGTSYKNILTIYPHHEIIVPNRVVRVDETIHFYFAKPESKEGGYDEKYFPDDWTDHYRVMAISIYNE